MCLKLKVIYCKSENFHVQKFSCKKFLSKIIFGCERLSEIKTPIISKQRIFVFLIFGYLEVSENILTPKISGFTVHACKAIKLSMV